MLIYDNKQVVSLGMSWFNQVQFDRTFGQNGYEMQRALARGTSITSLTDQTLFDFTLLSPSSLIQALEMYDNGTLKDIVCDINNYEDLGMDANMYHLGLRHKNFELFFIPYTPDDDISSAAFTHKWSAIIDNFLQIKAGNAVFIWSSIQPNLKKMIEDANEDWGKLYLTKAKFARINQLIHKLFGSTVVYVSCAGEFDEGIPGIHTIDIPRDDVNFEGPDGVYLPLFRELGLIDNEL